MNDMSRYFKPSVVALSPYTSARDEYTGDASVFLDANENPFDFDYNRYPDPYQIELKEAISRWRGIATESIFLGNGSDEIIDLLIQSTCKANEDRILTLDPSYGMYSVSAKINEIAIDLVAMNADLTVNETSLFSQLSERHKLIFICSPNNPNGALVDENLVVKLLQKTEALVVIDEAYVDFSDSCSWVKRLEEYSNLIVLQTFSKGLGGAGLRVGMAFMNKELVYYLNKVKPPYNISAPCQALALDRLQNMDVVSQSIQTIKVEREKLRKKLVQLSMVEYVFPSSANFLLVRLKDAIVVYENLKSQGIIVRNRSSQTCCSNCLRISIGTSNENEKLMDALTLINQNLR